MQVNRAGHALVIHAERLARHGTHVRSRPNAVSIPAQRFQRWSGIETSLGGCEILTACWVGWCAVTDSGRTSEPATIHPLINRFVSLFKPREAYTTFIDSHHCPRAGKNKQNIFLRYIRL